MTDDKKQNKIDGLPEDKRLVSLGEVRHVIKNALPPIVKAEVHQMVESKPYQDWKRSYIRRVLKDEMPNIVARVKEHLEAERTQGRSEAEQWWIEQFGEEQQD